MFTVLFLSLRGLLVCMEPVFVSRKQGCRVVEEGGRYLSSFPVLLDT